MTYKEAMEYTESLNAYGIVPGLESIRELCRRLGSPQDTLPFVHVAGTNGKGSVAAYISTVLKCAGYKVGRFVSPAIFEYRDEIQVNGRSITKKALCEGMDLLRGICGDMLREGYPHPTPFEIKTALAFWYFQKTGCDIVVLEAGMGGSLDATNVIGTTLAAVFASVSMDHMQFLGNSLEEIAEQKAGIIKSGCRVVSMKQQGKVLEKLRRTAEEKGCPFVLAEVDSAGHIRYGIERQRFDYGGYQKLEITLAGKYQIENAVLSVAVLETLRECGFPVKESDLRRGLLETVWTGRFTVLGRNPWFIADGAHNEEAAQRLAESLEFYFPGKRIIFILGVLQDKEYEKIIALTHRLADQIIAVTPPENKRAMPAYELAREIARVHPDVTAVDSLEEAVEMSRLLAGKKDVIAAFGSLSYLGRLIKIVEK